MQGSGGDFADKTTGMVVTVKRSTLSANSALRNGGGLHVTSAQLRIQDTQLLRNAVAISRNTPLLSAAGGGVFCSECTATISNSQMRDNTAALGAAAALPLSQWVIVEGSRFEGNRAGGALAEGATPGSSITAFSSSGTSNGGGGSSDYEGRSEGGAGLYVEANNVTLSNLTFINNTGAVAGKCSGCLLVCVWMGS